MVDKSTGPLSDAIIGVGAGGNAKCIMDIVRMSGNLRLFGLLDADKELYGHEIDGISVLGGDDMLDELLEKGVKKAFVGVGGVRDTRLKRSIYRGLVEKGYEVPSLIHPSASISPSAEIGRGATVMAGAIINAGAKLGENVLVNSGAIVEHDCKIGNGVHLATGSLVTGGVVVGNGTLVGAGSVIRQYLTIGEDALVAAGAVVLSDVNDGQRVAGVPARLMD